MDDAVARRYREAADWLLQLNSDDIPEEIVAGWLQWCEVDPANLRAYERIQSDWRDVVSLRRQPHGSVSEREASTVSVRRSTAASRWLLAAAIAAVIVGGAALWGGRAFLTAPQRIVAQTNNRTAVLPDGSALIVQAQSAVDLNFSDAERRLDLRENGEAYFKVRHDASRPFVVRAGSLRVTAIGTAFDVRRSAERTQVTVEEGRVQVALSDHRAFILNAGERFDSGGGSVVSKVDSTQAPRWRQGQFGYDGAPLAQVLEDVNRYLPRAQIHASDALAALPYTGTVFVNSVDDWLQALAATYPIVVARLDDGTIELRPSGQATAPPAGRLAPRP